jgi:hypothetical protein
VPTNRFFNNFNFTATQNLYENLIIETIKIYGADVLYMPRTLVKEDVLYAEDTLSIFDDAIELEMYVKDVEGFGGDGDILSRFGVQVYDTINLTVSKKRFEQSRVENLMLEIGYNMIQEDGNELILETATDQGYNFIPGSNTTTLSLVRPREGDLLWFPLSNSVFEVKFVEDEETFYPHGTLYTYELRCELFEFSSERFETGNSSIDFLADKESLDLRNAEVLLEDENRLLNEDGDSMILETFTLDGADVAVGLNIETIDPLSENDYYQQQAISIIDFSERNPFSELREY